MTDSYFTRLRATTPMRVWANKEENPRLCGWGAEVASIVAEEGSTTSMGRSCASPRHACPCRPPTTSKTPLCRARNGSRIE